MQNVAQTKSSAKFKTISPAEFRRKDTWHLGKVPPERDPDVGAFVYWCFRRALTERERLNLGDRWASAHKLVAGKHWEQPVLALARGRRSKLSLNLLGANIERTVANITAKTPMAQVKPADGRSTEASEAMSKKLQLWNSNEKQIESLAQAGQTQETYGICTEKMVFDSTAQTAYPVVLDPFAFLPAPGNWRDWNDAPYLIHAYTMDVDLCREKFDKKDVAVQPEEAYSVLGKKREKDRQDAAVAAHGVADVSMNAPGNYTPVDHPVSDEEESVSNKCLVLECWIRDYSKISIPRYQPLFDEETGEPLVDEFGGQIVEEYQERRLKYPGGIRVITVTNLGTVVLDDRPNPCVNPELPQSVVEGTYLYDRFPFYFSNSYRDTLSPFGFSMAEQVGDINLAIDDLWSTLTSYLRMMLFPPLILPRDTGIDKSAVRYIPRLVLQPNSANTAQGIRWLDMPSPPSWLFEALNTLLSFFDRISQVEDAERGDAPGSVIAASAIQMLQERAAVLMRAKIRSIDHLVRERGRCFISYYQNFGSEWETLEVNDMPMQMRGIEMSQYEFLYQVESGSTVAKTEAAQQQQAAELYKLGAIDRQALLEELKFPNWQSVIERMGESELDAALNILVKAGMPQEVAAQLKGQLLQPQGGPDGGTAGQQNPAQGQPGAGAPAQPGTPQAYQGQPQE